MRHHVMGAERTLAQLGVHTGTSNISSGTAPGTSSGNSTSGVNAAAAGSAGGTSAVASRPHLVNLSEDPAMVGRVVYPLKQGDATRVGSAAGGKGGWADPGSGGGDVDGDGAGRVDRVDDPMANDIVLGGLTAGPHTTPLFSST